MLQPVLIEDQAYLCPTWQEMGRFAVDLAQKIKQTDDVYDRVVALAKGGLSWNRQLQDLLQIKQTSSIQVRFYQGINQTAKRPIVIQSLPVTIEDESILIFDDIADTGESLIMAKEYLERHGTKSIKTATIFEKPWSKLKPEYSAQQTEAWVIFPHDAVENIKLLEKKWQVGSQEFQTRLAQIGIESSIVDFYLATNNRS